MFFVLSMIYGALETFVLWCDPGFAINHMIFGCAWIGFLALIILAVIISLLDDGVGDVFLPGVGGYLIGYIVGTFKMASDINASTIKTGFMLVLPLALGGLLIYGLFILKENCLSSKNKKVNISNSSSTSNIRNSYESSCTTEKNSFVDTSYTFESDLIPGSKRARGSDGKTYRIEPGLFPGDSDIRDCAGNKVGRIEKDIFTGKTYFYDKDGNKQGYMRDDPFDPYNKVYDNNGNEVGKYDDGLFGFGANYKPKD